MFNNFPFIFLCWTKRGKLQNVIQIHFINFTQNITTKGTQTVAIQEAPFAQHRCSDLNFLTLTLSHRDLKIILTFYASVQFKHIPSKIIWNTTMHSSRMRIVHCSGRLSCHAHMSPMLRTSLPPTIYASHHACPLTCTTPPDRKIPVKTTVADDNNSFFWWQHLPNNLGIPTWSKYCNMCLCP